MIKVLHLLTATEQNKAVGGAETLLLSMLRRIDKEKFNFVICYGSKGILNGEFKKAGADIVALDAHLHFDIPAILKIKKVIEGKDIDIVHSHQPRLDLLGTIAARVARRPMVLTRHLSISESPINAFKRFIFIIADRFTLNCVEKAICASKSIAEDLVVREGIERRKTDVIYAGLDLDIYDKEVQKGGTRKEFNIPLDAPLVGTIGRINAQKAHQYFLMAASEVLKEVPQARFLLIGDGPLKGAQEQLAKSLGIESNVVFTGFRSDIPEMIADMDIFALSSLTEALAVVNMEAMAMRKPVVSFKVGGVSELVVDTQTGLLITPKDWRSFARAILKLIRDKQMAHEMGLAGRKRVEENFALETMVHRHEQLYRDILQNRTKTG